MRALMIPLLMLSLLGNAHAATYRVGGNTGNDANDGIAAPFKTIARGLQGLQPGDTLLLTKMDRPYRESIPLKVHGTPQAPIIIDGGGATISGADTAPKEGWQNNAGVYSIAQAVEVKFLFGPDTRYEMAAAPEQLKPEQWAWKEGKLTFRPAEGKTPADYDLQMSVRISGVLTNGAGQIIVRNLTAMHFYNDGFNIHGGSAPLWFENIKGLWNGDEGFSCHENVEAYVRGAEFSHNYWHGIADVGIARTHYQNIVCRNNRAIGILLIGALHSVTDSEVTGSPQQIVLSPADLRGYPQWEQMPLRQSITNLRNMVVRSQPHETGIVVNNGAAGVIEHCVVLGGKVCVLVNDGGTAYAVNSIISGGQTAEVEALGAYLADHNLYFPGRLVIKGTSYGPEQFADYVAATKNDQRSFVEEPKFVGDTLVASRAGHAMGGAINLGGLGGPDIGLELRQKRPDEPGVPAAPPVQRAVAAAGGTAQPAAAGTIIAYDFETANPWSLVYPEPDKNAAGVAVTGTSELSAEQAHGGQKSAKLSVTVPAAPPPDTTIKLFSQKMPYTNPVLSWKFWLYGDGSKRTMTLRVRDRFGEGFYGPTVVIDWTGWKEVAWDLRQTAPRIAGGDQNQQQDGPPMELVAEIRARAGEQFALYLDDLQVEVGGGAATPAPAPAPAPTPAPAPPAAPAVTGQLPAWTEPDALAAAPEPVRTTTPNGRLTHFYDFEQANPWGRIYPEPTTNQAGEPLRGLAELSAEQKHAGERSLKLAIQTPAGPPAGVQVKLFSNKFAFSKPIKAVRFWIFGDGSGRVFKLRLRDRGGESFYDAGQKMDFTGWRQVTWDLDQRPPANIAGGNKNQAMDGPPLELVLELNFNTAQQTPQVLYLDDLEIDLEP